MMKLQLIHISSVLILLSCVLFASSCKQEIDYRTLVEQGLAKEVRHDKIVLDIGFGMGSKEFYDYCWKLNKEGKAGQGPKNRSVQVEIEEFSNPSYMLFYPNFIDEKIAEMPILFAAHKWSPWNKEVFSSKIIYEVRDLVESWYDTDMHLMYDTNEFPGYLGIKGNKRIAITIQDDQFVKVLVSDMTIVDPGESLVYKRN